MNINQMLIIELLSAAIRNEKIVTLGNRNVEWDAIYEEAKAQGIHTLLYPVLKELNIREEINAEIMQKWQKSALSQSMFQLQLMNEVQKILTSFHNEGIKAIALKGIIIRELYPYPELRSMGDADILLRSNDMDRAKEILLELGFFEGGINPEHTEFRNKNGIEIELHGSLIGEGRFRKDVKLEETVWDNAIETSVFDVPVLMPDKGDHFLYIGLHMAKHMINSGFGIRQLTDFVLLYESIKSWIDWNDFFKNLDKYGAQKFFTILFLACEQLFSINLPDCKVFKLHGNRKYAQLLIKDIFESGLYGYKNPSRTLGSFALRKVKSEETKNGTGKIKYFRQLLFPGANQLSTRYGYVLKYPALLPFAWVHRIITNIFRNEFSIKEKISFFKQYGKRSELLGWLDIR